MRRIAVYRDGNRVVAQIGPDWVEGIAGFGHTVATALRDLEFWFDRHGYERRGDSAGVEVAGTFIKVRARLGNRLRMFYWRRPEIVDERGFQESDFPEPDWKLVPNEERVTRPYKN